MNDQQRAKKLKTQDTERSWLVCHVASHVTKHIEENGAENVNLENTVQSVLEKYSHLGDKFDANSWNWENFKRDVKRVTALNLS